MPIAFSCPECDKPLRVKDELAGRKIKCPGCASAVAVPESDEGAAITKAPARKKVEAPTARKPVKKSARVVDDDDEDDDDEAPRGKHGARKSRRKAGAASSSLYLYLGISAGVVVALAVTLTIIFWPKKEDKSDAPSKDTPKDRQQVIANNNIPKPPERPIQVGLGESKPEVYKRLLKSAAWIQLSTGSLGSGALIDRQEQLVVTNFHVAGSVSSVTVYFPYYQDKAAQLAGKPNTDPRWYMDPKNSALASVHANVVWKDAKRDLALVQLGSVPPDIAAVPLLGRSAKIGEHVHSVGSSGINDGGMWRYTWGAVRNVYKAEKMFPSGPVNCQWIETNAPTNHGDSGGPIVNDKGQLVGLVQGGVNADPADRERVVSFNVDVSEIHHILGEYYKSKGKTYELPKLDDIDPSDVLAISKKLEDPDPSVRLQAIRAIAEFGPEARPFIRPLVKVWDDSNATLRSAATKALEQIGPPPAEEASLLFDLVSSPVVEKKRYAAEVLATPNLVKRDQALPALLTLAKDGDAETRRKAVLGLGSVGTVNRKEAGATLAQCLGDQDASVRASAAAALGKLRRRSKPKRSPGYWKPSATTMLLSSRRAATRSLAWETPPKRTCRCCSRRYRVPGPFSAPSPWNLWPSSARRRRKRCRNCRPASKMPICAFVSRRSRSPALWDPTQRASYRNSVSCSAKPSRRRNPTTARSRPKRSAMCACVRCSFEAPA